MKLYSENKNYKLYQGNMLDMLEAVEPNSIDSIVTDPPYELNFMGKGWDNAGISFNKETWEKCFEVLKPGGYILAFGGSRTYHRIAVAIEDAGFEIRDTIMWLYGSGFPKSLNISKTLEKREGIIEETTGTLFNNPGGKRDLSKRSDYGYVYEPQIGLAKQWNGWGTCLKPSFEPIIVARKPFKGSLVDNVIENGVGGLNIDECRVGTEKIYSLTKDLSATHGNNWGAGTPTPLTGEKVEHIGRFPANTILTYDETDFDEVCGGFPYTKSTGGKGEASKKNTFSNVYNGGWGHNKECANLGGLGDSGSASRYFYCAKASKKDRDEGLEDFDEKLPACVTDFRPTLLTNPENWNNGEPVDNPMMRMKPKKNIHPTVKPTELMQYLVRLVTPNGGIVLDPFNGSGSTGKAVMYENKEKNKNYKYIGIELTEEYLPIAQARIEYVCDKEEKVTDNQTNIFDFMEE